MVHVHVVGLTTIPVQSVTITTEVVSSNPTQARCTQYNKGWWFSPVSSTYKTDRHDITEISDLASARHFRH
jgi:hypothetical protein